MAKNKKLTKQQKQQAAQLQKDLVKFDQEFFYNNYTSKAAFYQGIVKPNSVSETKAKEMLKTETNSKSAITINDNALMKGVIADYKIHNLTLRPIQGTDLTHFSGICYNKSTGKNMQTSLLLAIHNDVKSIKVDVAVLKTDMVKVKADIKDLKKDVNGLKSDMVKVKSDVKGLKSDMVKVKAEIKAVKKDLADTKKKNNLK